MKSLFLILCIISSTILLMSSKNSGEITITSAETDTVKTYVDEEMKALISELTSLGEENDPQKLENHYFLARKHFKHIEFFVEHVSPGESKYQINGALVPKYFEYKEGFQLDPHGFQRIEELLFSGDSIVASEVKQEAEDLKQVFDKLQKHYRELPIENNLYLEMVQFQLIRMVAMNLNGYDATFTQTNVEEACWNLESMQVVQQQFQPLCKSNRKAEKTRTELGKKLKKASSYLEKHPDFESFDRLEFITSYMQPINREIVDLHRALQLPWSDYKQAIYLNNYNLFSADSYNRQFFSIYYKDSLNLNVQAELGKLLFFDPILSGNNQRSCASCHQPDKAFTDGLTKSLAFDRSGQVARNAPTLIDVAFQKAFFYDGKAYQLEQQVRDVVHNRDEMGSSLKAAVEKLRQSETYRRYFDAAFFTARDKAISEYAVQKAISEYEKTLVSFDSRFDRYLAGERSALTGDEKKGYNLFAGKAMCGTCHFFPVFNGTVPPYYLDSEFEIIGTPETAENKKLDSDKGRFTVTKASFQEYAFKTPGIRNCEITAPYMHNGVYKDLESVVDFYQKGGGKGLRYDVPNQTLPFDTLVLSPVEKKYIVSFLKSLSDTTHLRQNPFPLPVFENKPEWNTRTWGGNY